MRKVTEQIIRAWSDGQSKTVGNTTTDGESIWLHGNEIIRSRKNGALIEFNFCGWGTPTTKERINGVCYHIYGTRPFHTVNFQLMRDGVPINEDGWQPLCR